MLHTFLTAHQGELIDRCRLKVAGRSARGVTGAEWKDGIPLFLEQLIRTLRVEQTSEPMQSRRISGDSGGGAPAPSEIGVTAARHGRELLRYGYTVDQVVHDYGDLCQAITEMAFERRAPIEVDEFRTLNRCLDNAIADAVTAFACQRSALITDRELHAFNERLGVLAHEMRNLIQTATLAVAAIKGGNVGLSGATGSLLDRSLLGLANLVDQSLADVRATEMRARHKLIAVADLIAAVEASARLEARTRECVLAVSAVDPRLAVDVDRDPLCSAVGNLLQNAFKFTAHQTEVSLSAYAAADRILIDVEDNCGGLPPGEAEHLFLPFTQRGADKSGVGLGLSIARRSVEANNGVLRVRDVPGKGCVFTIDLPRHSLS